MGHINMGNEGMFEFGHVWAKRALEFGRLLPEGEMADETALVQVDPVAMAASPSRLSFRVILIGMDISIN